MPCTYSSVENLEIEISLKISIENSSSLYIFFSMKGFPRIFEKIVYSKI